MPAENPTIADLARLIPRLVYVSPTAETLNLDGVEARVWAGISEGGNPMRLAVHRVFFEPEHEAASVEEFPILQAREKPKRFELESAVRLLDQARAERDRFKAALAGVLDLHSEPGESTSDRWERVADLFHRETRYLRPGKSEPLECSHPDEERVAAYEKWVAARLDAARAALREITEKPRG